MELRDPKIEKIDQLELSLPTKPHAIYHLNGLKFASSDLKNNCFFSMLAILCIQTEAVDEAQLDLYSESVRVEDTTFCFFVSLENLGLYKSFVYPKVLGEKSTGQSTFVPELNFSSVSSKYLNLHHLIKIKVLLN